MADHLLNLDTKNRPQIKIDGVEYDILQSNDLSIVEMKQVERKSVTLNGLLGDADLDDAGAADAENALHSMTDIILKCVPDDVRARLSDAQRIQVIEVFMRPSNRAAKRASKPKKQTGTKSRRASSGSTAATQPGG